MKYNSIKLSKALDLAEAYKLGIGRSPDYAQARRLYRMCARSKDRKIASLGQYNLAIFYYYGLGVEKDAKKAFELFLKSVILFPTRQAYLKLGDMYRYGEYVEKNEAISVNFYSQSLLVGS